MSYVPISCSFYDELEAFATLRKEILIVFWNERKEKVFMTGVINTFFIRDNIEIMRLNNGKEIRLDHIISAGEKYLSDYQYC
jgi:Rho-binding antiterminator